MTSLRAEDVDRVELDPGSGTFSRSLPFDVPFLVVGTAPPGSATARLRWEEANPDAIPSEQPLLPDSLPAAVSGIDGQGRFQFRMEALEPNRAFRFALDVERRLDDRTRIHFGTSVRLLLDQSLVAWSAAEASPERAVALLDALGEALQRAVNDGRVIAAPRGSSTATAPSPLLDEGTELGRRSERLDALTLPVREQQAARAAALERSRDATTRLESELLRLRGASGLAALLEALGRDPELNPRNPRSPAALPAEALALVGMSDAELEAAARGQSASEAPLALADTLVPEEAETLRIRYHRLARAARELRDWLEWLLATSGGGSFGIERLAASGQLSPGQIDALRRLTRDRQGALRRSEDWAETLEASAWEVQRALSARERELDRVAAEIEAAGLAATIHQRIGTDVATTSAGWYVSMDLGVVYPPRLDRAALYAGANVYFRPVNKRASLREHGSLAHRLALTLGVTLTDLALEDETRIEPLLGESSNLVLGLGFRITPSIRLGAGAVLFLKNDPNPLVTSRSLGATPYVSASFDVDLMGIIRRLSE